MENNNKNQQNQEKGKDFKTVQNSNSYKDEVSYSCTQEDYYDWCPCWYPIYNV